MGLEELDKVIETARAQLDVPRVPTLRPIPVYLPIFVSCLHRQMKQKQEDTTAEDFPLM